MPASDPIDFLSEYYGTHNSDQDDPYGKASHDDNADTSTSPDADRPDFSEASNDPDFADTGDQTRRQRGSGDSDDDATNVGLEATDGELGKFSVAQDGRRVLTPPYTAQYIDYTCIEDTPAGQHTASTRSYQMGNLNEMRQAVRDHVGPNIVEISFDEFAEQYLPPLNSALNTHAIVKHLEKQGLFSPTKKVLTDFNDEPKKSKEREEDVLEPLTRVFGEICRHASPDIGVDGPEYFLGMLPNYMPYVDVSMEHRPDGAFFSVSKKDFVSMAASVKGETEPAKKNRNKMLKEMKREGKHITYHDIAVPFEGKKRVSGLDDNVVKLVFHGQQLIAHDPSRCFVIGITIENTDLRLWFMSRTRTIVSKAFNFTTDIIKLTRVVVSLSFATREELGYDRTIQPLLVRNKWQYNIRVGERQYRTNRVIADGKAHALLSTGTRVWYSTDVASREQVAIKDTWIECDRYSEKSIYEMILGDVEELYGEEGRDVVASLLLKPVADCVVGTDHPGTADDPPGIRLFPMNTQKKRSGDRSGPSASRGKGPPRSFHFGDNPTSTVPARRPRVHYRVVFSKTGGPLYTVEKLSDAFLILKNSSECLSFLHGCGWVHRDLSSGNVYLYQGRGLVGDLEYARNKSWKDAPHEMHTVNFDYMASEVIERDYLFHGFHSKLETRSDSPCPPFRHNELHDLESLLWIAVYIILFMLETGIETDLDEREIKGRSRRREEARQALFPGTNITKSRREFLTEHGKFEDFTSWMPHSFKDIKGSLNLARNELVQCYIEYEGTFGECNFRGLHETFITCFRHCETVAVTLQRRFGGPLILESFTGHAAMTAAPKTDAEDAIDSGDDEELPEVARNASANPSGRGRKGQKRDRSPEEEVVAKLRKRGNVRGAMQPKVVQGPSKRPVNPRRSTEIGGKKTQKRGK